MHAIMAEKNKGVGFSDDAGASDNDPDRTELISVLEKLSLGSETKKKKLLVLSLGGVLVRRFHAADMWKLPKDRSPDATYGAYYVFKRPFCEEFMRFCLDRFEVGIWSSAMERNINLVLDSIMKGLKGRLLFVMDQNDCIDSGFMSLEKKTKPLFFKDLSTVFHKFNSETDEPPRFSYANTLMIDDNPYKSFLNPYNTSVFTATYDAEDAEDNLLDPKGELCSYLDELADASDVQDYVKEHPFGQPKIGPSHPDWHFYKKVAAFVKKKTSQSN